MCRCERGAGHRRRASGPGRARTAGQRQRASGRSAGGVRAVPVPHPAARAHSGTVSAVDAAASFIYGTDILVRSATGLIGEPAQVGGRLGVFLIVMDTFLVGATLMVSAFGFYELFIVRAPGNQYRLPRWLRMHDLEDLKARVVSMLVLVVAITFVDRTVESHDEQEVLFLGLGISIIIVALTVFLWLGRRSGAAPSAVAVAGGPGGGIGGG
ncbi:MAG: YqhA family protein, partial [Streptosporangiaceae bacterium]